MSSTTTMPYQNQGQARRRHRALVRHRQFIYYALTDQVRAGLRFEWMRDEAGAGSAATRSGQTSDRSAGSFYSVSVGLNYQPHPNVLIRPKSVPIGLTGNDSPFNDGLNKESGVSGDQRQLRRSSNRMRRKRPPAAFSRV